MASGDYVILVHGLGRTKRSLFRPYLFLKRQGYHVLWFSYPSTRYDIQYLADHYLDRCIQQFCSDCNKQIHFVSHSMGGIVVRSYLSRRKLPQLGRVVMLAPPNQGSEFADLLKPFALYQSILGPAAQQLGTDEHSLPNQLGAVEFELGIIAACRSINPFSSLIFPGVNDGMVSCDRTQVKGMTDFLIVEKTHYLIMNSQEVLEQIDHFLEHGYFERNALEQTQL